MLHGMLTTSSCHGKQNGGSSKRIQTRTIIRSRDSSSGNLSEECENTNWKRYIHPCVHCSTASHGQGKQAAWASCGWVDKGRRNMEYCSPTEQGGNLPSRQHGCPVKHLRWKRTRNVFVNVFCFTAREAFSLRMMVSWTSLMPDSECAYRGLEMTGCWNELRLSGLLGGMNILFMWDAHYSGGPDMD